MTLNEAITSAGGDAAFGRTLDPPVTGQAVGVWRKRGWVPTARVTEIADLYGIERKTLMSDRVRQATV